MARPKFISIARPFTPREALATATTEEGWLRQLFAPPVEPTTASVTVQVPNAQGELGDVEQTATAVPDLTTPDNLPDLTSVFTEVNETLSVFQSGNPYGSTETGASTRAEYRFVPDSSIPGVARPGRAVSLAGVKFRLDVLRAYNNEGWTIYYANPGYTPGVDYEVTTEQNVTDVVQVEYFLWTPPETDNPRTGPDTQSTYYFNPSQSATQSDILDTHPGDITQTVVTP